MPSKVLTFQDMTITASEGLWGGAAIFTVRVGSQSKSFTEEAFIECVYPLFKAMFSQPSSSGS